MGADIAVGSAQRFGVPLGFGGPHASFIASKEALKRELPGRLVGVSADSSGGRALRLALQTREQHIRRQRAKSNICTAQVLPAVMSALYAVFHGEEGLRAIASRVHARAVRLRNSLRAAGFKVGPEAFFDTITVEVGDSESAIHARLDAAGINLRLLPGHRFGISVDELVDEKTLLDLCAAFDTELAPAGQDVGIPEDLRRTTACLSHSVFHLNRSEAGLTRFMRRLADQDLALDRTMIPLGSCTMKLNAATEMMPVTWPELGQIHPLAPKEQIKGYLELIDDLSRKLCEITGFDAISMQPNSGAQGEYAGLLAIRRYHSNSGQTQRDICLIPKSAHGTNAASASMAGYEVVEIGTTEDGSVDLDDMARKADEFGSRIAATMVTYPSTHGVFESGIRRVIALTHGCGGQVYLDGANLNALLGIAKPGELGADVAHLNLHKTFCIPHGGGGPGMGPIGVRAHLADFLPGDPATGRNVGAVSSSMYGSASILAVSWAYLLLMGGEGPVARNANCDPEFELRGPAPQEQIRDLLFREERAGGARVHRRPPAFGRRNEPDGRGYRQAADRFRLPSSDHELAGARHADGRADGVGAQGRARPVLRRDAPDRGRNRGGQGREGRSREQRPAQRTAYRPRPRRRLGPPVFKAEGVLSRGRCRGFQILAAR